MAASARGAALTINGLDSKLFENDDRSNLGGAAAAPSMY